MAARARVRMIRVLAAASADTVRWGLAVIPMAAVAFVGPWALMVQLSKVWRDVDAEVALLIGSTTGLGCAMQSLLLEVGAVGLKPARTRWRAGVWTIYRRLGADLVINLVALLLTGVAAALCAVIVGISTEMMFRHGDASGWAALGGAVLGGVIATFLLSRWSIATAAAHVESLGVVEALQRSADLTRGYRLQIAAVQAVYLCAWPAALFAGFYLAEHVGQLGFRRGDETREAVMEVALGLLGVLAGMESFGKTRLYREVATLEGEVGQARVLEVFN